MSDRADAVIRRWDVKADAAVYQEALRVARAAASPIEFVDPVTPLTHHDPCGLGDVDTVCSCPTGWPRTVKP